MVYTDICKSLALGGGRVEERNGHSRQEVACVQACQVGKMRPKKKKKNHGFLPKVLNVLEKF